MDIEKYIYSSCHNPIQVKVYNGITNCYEYKDVPCGKCYHCKITRINEWVTRMVVQSNYSNYVYFGTLTYNGKNATLLNDECMSISSNFNKTKKYNDTPLVLRKDHVQKFFKRLRKNTGVKMQYAYCGEYGSTYSRPHYHYIIWCNEPISALSVYKAWSAPSKKDPNKKVCIGKIEHRDIKHNSYPCGNDVDNTKVYKYVCKYIQKCDFNFDDLKNIKEHYINFKKHFDYVKDSKGNKVYLSNKIDEWIKSKNIEDWRDYTKVFSPFFMCSKQPAIGYQYFKDNLGEFQKGNFKLFGLSGKYVFPLYFVRKTKESLCPLKAQSEVNSGATSYSRLPKMAALLENIQLSYQIAEDTNQVVQLFRRDDDYNYSLEWYGERIQDLREYDEVRDDGIKDLLLPHVYKVNFDYLGFVNIETHVRYSFRGNYYAMYSTNGDDYIGNESIENVKLMIKYYYERLKKQILLPLYFESEVSANQKEALIEELGGIEKFKEKRDLCISNLMNAVNQRQNIYKQSKVFE